MSKLEVDIVGESNEWFRESELSISTGWALGTQ